MKKRAGKKVEGSDYGEVPVEGLRDHRKGTDAGSGRSKPLQDKIPNIVSGSTKNPYSNKRKISKPEYHGIDVTVESDDKAMKKFIEEG